MMAVRVYVCTYILAPEMERDMTCKSLSTLMLNGVEANRET